MYVVRTILAIFSIK